MFKKIKRLIYLSGIYSLGSIFENALGFIFIPIYTAYLGVYDYGIVGLMSITVGLLSTLLSTPIVNGFTRHYYVPAYENKQGLLLFNSFLLLSLQAIIISVIFYILKNSITVVILEDVGLVRIVEVYSVILFLQPLSIFFMALLRQKERAGFFVFISSARLIVSATTILVGLLYFKIGVLALIYGNLVGVIFTVVFIFPFLWRHCTPEISPSILGPPLRYGYPLIIEGISLLLIQAGDRYVIKLFSSLATVGLYSFGYNFAGIMVIALIMPLKQALQPLVLKQEGEPEELKAFLRNNCTFFYLIGMYLCLFLSLYGKEGIEVLARKKEFWSSWIIIPVIAFSYLQHGLGNFFNYGLMMTKKSYFMSRNVAVAAVLNIGLNLVLVPYWGIMGAALATLVAYIAWNVLKIHYSGKFYGLYFDIKRLGHITIIGAGLYIVSLLTAEIGSLSIEIFLKFILLLAYPVLFFLTGFFLPLEKVYMRRLWKSIKMNGLRETYAKIKAI